MGFRQNEKERAYKIANERMKMLNAERVRQQSLKAAQEQERYEREQAILGREQDLTDDETKQKYRIALEREQENLIRTRPANKFEEDYKKAHTRKINAEIENMKLKGGQAEGGGISTGMKPNEILNYDERTKDEINSIIPESYIDKNGKSIKAPFEERAMLAQQANNREGNPVYYKHVPEVITPYFSGGPDIPERFEAIHLPRVKGRQITSQDIVDTMNTINPRTGKYYTSDEVINELKKLR